MAVSHSPLVVHHAKLVSLASLDAVSEWGDASEHRESHARNSKPPSTGDMGRFTAVLLHSYPVAAVTARHKNPHMLFHRTFALADR